MKSYSMGTTNDYISKQPLENSTLVKAGVFFYTEIVIGKCFSDIYNIGDRRYSYWKLPG